MQVPGTRIRDFKYFEALNDWVDNGGAAAWLHFLQQFDISAFNVRTVPSTAALDIQKIESLTPIDRWLLEALDQGISPAGRPDWTDGVTLVCGVATAASPSTANGLADAGHRRTRASSATG